MKINTTMKTSILFAIVVLVPFLNAASVHKLLTFQYTNCSKNDDTSRGEIISITVTPDPPKKGDKVNISFNFLIKEEITSGLLAVTLNYGDISIVDEKLDLCDLITQINKQCPISKGSFDFTFSEIIPSYIPSGKYEGKAIMYDQAGQELGCLDLKITL